MPLLASKAEAKLPFVRFVNRLSLVGGYLAALAIVALLVLICVEIAMRNMLGRSTLISDEFAGYLNAMAIFLGLGYTLRERGFIRVELVYDRLRGRMLTFSRWSSVLTSLTFVGIMLYYAAKQVIYLYQNDITSSSFYQTPLYLPQLGVVVGLLLLLLQLLTYALGRVRDLP